MYIYNTNSLTNAVFCNDHKKFIGRVKNNEAGQKLDYFIILDVTLMAFSARCIRNCIFKANISLWPISINLKPRIRGSRRKKLILSPPGEFYPACAKD